MYLKALYLREKSLLLDRRVAFLYTILVEITFIPETFNLTINGLQRTDKGMIASHHFIVQV